MTPRGLCFWLKGYLEAAQKSSRLTPHEMAIVEKLAAVEMPPRPPEPWCGFCGVEDGQPHEPGCERQHLLAEGVIE
jgi:hypothetical protein